MDFLKLLEEYENYKRGFGIEPKSSGHSACVDFAIWLNNNASQQSVYSDVCHKSPSKTHSWYGSSQGYVCEHCGTRR